MEENLLSFLTKLCLGYRRGFEAYRKSLPAGNFVMYRALCDEVTRTFQSISQSVLEIETRLQGLGRDDLVEIVHLIQSKNAEKLKLVMLLHYPG